MTTPRERRLWAGAVYVLRNSSDDSEIAMSNDPKHAEEVAAQVKDGRHDNNPRDCWIEVAP